MRKKLSMAVFMLLAPVFLLFACGDPYQNFELTVDKQDIVLYVGDNLSVADESLETADIVATVSGGEGNINRNVEVSQTGNAVTYTTSRTDDKTTISVRATRPGRSLLTINTLEGNKRQDVTITVYKKIEGVEFTESTIALRTKSSTNLNNFVNFSPIDTNQKEMDFYLIDAFAPDAVYDNNGNLIECRYAKISPDGTLTAKPDARFPQNDLGQDAIKVVGVSRINPEIRTSERFVLVADIIAEEEIFLKTNGTNGDVTLTKNGNFYEIVLANNFPDNELLFKRILTFNMGGTQNIDRNYVVTTNKISAGTNNQSVVQLTDMEPNDDRRINYDPYTAGYAYPYKKYEFQQLKQGTETITFKIDRIGFEGLFTINIQVKVTVKKFPTEVETYNDLGQEILKNSTEKLTVFDVYDTAARGEFLRYEVNPYSAQLDAPIYFSFSVTGMPTGFANALTIVNRNNAALTLGTKYQFNNTNNFNIAYLKHSITSTGLGSINLANPPKLILTFFYSVSPSGAETNGYRVFELKKEIPLDLKLGLTPEGFIVNENLKINLATGSAMNEMGTALPQAILAETNEFLNLNETIRFIEITHVNGNPVTSGSPYSASNFNPMNNKIFSLEYAQNPSSGLYNRLVIVPNTNGYGAVITIRLTTVNGYVKTATINFFVPLVYHNGESMFVEVPGIQTGLQEVFDHTTVQRKVTISETAITVAELLEGEEPDLKYETVTHLILATNSRIPLKIYNLLPNEDRSSMRLLNFNEYVTINASSTYFRVDKVEEGGVVNFYLNTLTQEYRTGNLTVSVNIRGLNASGIEINLTHRIYIQIHSRITNVVLTPASTTLYEAGSLGMLNKNESTVTINVITTPLVTFDGVAVKRTFNVISEPILVYNETVFTTEDVVDFNKTTGQVTAQLMPSAWSKLNAYDASQRNVIIAKLFAAPVVVRYEVHVQQFSKLPVVASGIIYIRQANKIETIIPSVGMDGLYFDTVHNSIMEREMSFRALPTEAYNTKLIATIRNESVAQITSGVDSNGYITSANNVIKVRAYLAGETSIVIAAADSYIESIVNGHVILVPSFYIELRIKVADGSAENPFELRTAGEFLYIGSDIAAGHNSYHYVLAANINLSRQIDQFGEFNGGLSGWFTYQNTGVWYTAQNALYGFSVNANLTISDTNYNKEIGLFSSLGENAIISNFHIEEANIELNINNTTGTVNTSPINVGILAAVNKGRIESSRVSGNINVTVNADVENINVGGMVGVNKTTLVAEIHQESQSLIHTQFTGTIYNTPSNNNFNNGNVNSTVNISFYGPITVADTNRNIGVLVGLAEQEFTYGNKTVYDISPQQLLNKGAVFNNVAAAGTAQARVAEGGTVTNANIGGLIGKTKGVFIDTATVSTQIFGYENLGGIVGFAENTYIRSAAVEFANAGNTGLASASIVGYNNLGGIAGAGKNLNIQFSNARSYYGSKTMNASETDPQNSYAGNIVLLSQGTNNNVYVGGLVGYLDNQNISEPMEKYPATYKDDSDNFIELKDLSGTLNREYNGSKYVAYKNTIVNSYFNADINTNWNIATENVYVGGLVGGNEETSDKSLLISDSYVLGKINKFVPESITLAPVATPKSGVLEEVGEVTTYSVSAADSRIIEEKTVVTTETATDYVRTETINYIPYFGALLGTEELELAFTADANPVVKHRFNSGEITDTEYEETPENPYAENDVKTKTTTTADVYAINTQLPKNTIVSSSYFVLNNKLDDSQYKLTTEDNANSQYAGVFEVNSNIYGIGTATSSSSTPQTAQVAELVVENTRVEGIIYIGGNWEDLAKEYNTNNANYTVTNLSVIQEKQEKEIYNLFTQDNGFSMADVGHAEEAQNVKPVPANPLADPQTKATQWLLYTGFNLGHPVLFTYNSIEQVNFKLIPTFILATVIDFSSENFNNRGYVKVSDTQLVLFYNQNAVGTNPAYMNQYTIKRSTDNTTSDTAVNVIDVNLNLQFDAGLGVSAIVDTSLVITSSSSIIKVLDGGKIQTNGLGVTTLRIASKLDASVYSEIEVLVVNGISDFNLYYNRNANRFNRISSIFEVDEYIDQTSFRFIDTENSLENGSFSTSYLKNTSVGYKVEVSPDSLGEIEINNLSIESGFSYTFASLGEFNVKGKNAGNVIITVTPFIITAEPFGEYIVPTGAGSTVITDRCIVIPQLIKQYTFKVMARAESISTNNKTSSSISPSGTTDVTVSVVTSNFTGTPGNITVDEDLIINIYNADTGAYIGVISLKNKDSAVNNTLLEITDLGYTIEPIYNEHSELLKIKVDYKLRFSFDTLRYRNRTNNPEYNINKQNFKIVFSPLSDSLKRVEFGLKVVAQPVTSIASHFYPSGEYDGDGETGVLNPMEQSSDYIAPGRAGLLKLNVFPEFSEAEYVELDIDPTYRNLISLTQNLAVMQGDENSLIRQYETLNENPVYTQNRALVLRNKSMRLSSNEVLFTGAYFVRMFLAAHAPQGQSIIFTVTAFKTVNNVPVPVKSIDFTLRVEHLPNVYLNYNGSQEGVAARGTQIELNLVSTNVERVEFEWNSTRVSVYHNTRTNKVTVDIGNDVAEGFNLTITARGIKTLNGKPEEKISTVFIRIVPFVINGFELSGAFSGGTVNGLPSYNMEILNGTTNALRVDTQATYNAEISSVANRMSIFNSMISGNMLMDLNESLSEYLNNWYRFTTLGTTGETNFELLSTSATYNDYQFVSIEEPSIGDAAPYHFYGIRPLRVPVAGTQHKLAFIFSFYYDRDTGFPQKFDPVQNSAEQSYEFAFIINLTIKDNSTYDHPNPIDSASAFNDLRMVNTGHYILTNDIVLEDYVPFAANFSSLDGNGYTITVKNFDTTMYKGAGNVVTGLFETTSKQTLLKNMTIDVSELLISKQEFTEFNRTLANSKDETVQNKAKINLAFIPNVTFGMLVGQNNGSITNCRVVNLKAVDLTQADGTANKKYLHVNTTQNSYNNAPTNAIISAFVGINSGSISNSFVGRNMGGVTFGNGSANSTAIGNINVAYRLAGNKSDARIKQSYSFTLTGGKTIAAFVGTNNGVVANCYNKEVGVINVGTAEFAGASASGFVLTNNANGQIFNCFSEGNDVTNFRASRSAFAVAIENIGYTGGFVHTNSGSIKNSYANITIRTTSGGMGEFVYNNLEGGNIENCYATAISSFGNLARGQFTGADHSGNINNKGKIFQSYYLVYQGESPNFDDPALPIQAGEPSDDDKSPNPFRYPGSFNGFSFTQANATNNIWRIPSDSNYGPQLVSTVQRETFSQRYLISSEDDNGAAKYNYDYVTRFTLGSSVNPLLVNQPEEFIKFIVNNSTLAGSGDKASLVFGLRADQGVSSRYSVRLVNNLDFNDIDFEKYFVDDRLLGDVIFAGDLDGNGMTMSGIQMNNTRGSLTDFGLFKQIGLSEEQRKPGGLLKREITEDQVSTSIQNVTLRVGGFGATNADRVGVLAGVMYNTTLINTEIAAEKDVIIAGKNLVGGYAGLIINNQNQSIVDVRTNNISVTASLRKIVSNESTYIDEFGAPYGISGGHRVYSDSDTYRDINADYGTSATTGSLSYAGSIAGVLIGNNRLTKDSYPYIAQDQFGENSGAEISTDNDVINSEAINVHRSTPEQNKITNLKAYGGGLIQAENAGGLFGYVGENTHIKTASYIVGLDDREASFTQQRIIGFKYAGGIVAENYGFLEKVFVEHSQARQAEYDNTIYNSNGLGELNLFDSISETSAGTSERAYPVAIGGIAGFTDRSIILDSYSKVSVVSDFAKVAGGLIGIASRENYISHTYTTGDVFATRVIGGAVGLYNQTGKNLIKERYYGTVTYVNGAVNLTPVQPTPNLTKKPEHEKDIYKMDAAGNYFLKVWERENSSANSRMIPSQDYMLDADGYLLKDNEPVKWVKDKLYYWKTVSADANATYSDSSYSAFSSQKLGTKEDLYFYVNSDEFAKIKEQKTNYYVKIGSTQKLYMDYVFALNLWGLKAKNALIANLNKYYKKESEDASYYSYVLRMPEVGNQQPLLANGGKAEVPITYLGSVIGRLKVGDKWSSVIIDTSNSENITNAAPNADINGVGKTEDGGTTKNLVANNRIAYDHRKVSNGSGGYMNVGVDSYVETGTRPSVTNETSNINYTEAALLTSRRVKVLNKDVHNGNAWGNGRNTVISTTFADAKISNGVNTKFDNAKAKYDSDFTGIKPGVGSENAVGDYLFYSNHLGMQFQLNNIYGLDNLHSNMLNMFKLDSEVSKVDSEEETKRLQEAFSKLWRMPLEGGYLPEYITGIYKNYTVIETYEDLLALAIERNTAGQFYFIGKNTSSSDEIGSYQIDETGGEGVRNFFFRHEFQGTLIGIPYTTGKEDVYRNPVIISSSTQAVGLFQGISMATIQNVDFEIRTPLMDKTASTGAKSIPLAAGTTSGLFAGEVVSSVITNCNFSINSMGVRNYTINTNMVKTFGVFIGAVSDSSLSNLNFTVYNNLTIEAKDPISEIGVVAGRVNRTAIANIQTSAVKFGTHTSGHPVIGTGSEAHSFINIILLGENNNELSIGLFGLVQQSSNLNGINQRDSMFSPQFSVQGSIASAKTPNTNVNLGGIAGRILGAEILNASFYGSLKVGSLTASYNPQNGQTTLTGEKTDINTGSYNVGGIAGKAESGVIERVLVGVINSDPNEFLVTRGKVPTSDGNGSVVEDSARIDINTMSAVNAGGLVGFAGNTRIAGVNNTMLNNINASNIHVLGQGKNYEVGGLVGRFDNTFEDTLLVNAINSGTIVFEAADSNNIEGTANIGGVLGRLLGGKVTQTISYGNIEMSTGASYNIGGMVGHGARNKNANAEINNYICYGDIIIKGGKKPEATGAYVGGVLGFTSTVNNVKINDGYTMGRMQGTPIIYKNLAGIGFQITGGEAQPRNYYVYEFNPYSTETKYEQSIDYANAVRDLWVKLKNENNSFDLSNEPENWGYTNVNMTSNLPNLKNMLSLHVVDRAYNNRFLGDTFENGAKLNPKYKSTGFTIGSGADALHHHYIIKPTGSGLSINATGTFTGGLYGQTDSSKEYPIIKMTADAPQMMLTNNNGIVSGFRVYVNSVAKAIEYGNFGYIAQTNMVNGVIINCVTYGEYKYNVAGQQIGGLAHTNQGKILKSGSSITYTKKVNVDANTKIGGLAVENTGSIFDSYSTSSVLGEMKGVGDSDLNLLSSGTAVFGGLVYNNTGNIKNAYFAGANHVSAWGASPIAALNGNGSSYTNVYYDAEAARENSKTAGGVVPKTTAQLQLPAATGGITLSSEDPSIWSTQDLATDLTEWNKQKDGISRFDLNYGYPVIKGGGNIWTTASVNTANNTITFYARQTEQGEITGTPSVPLFHVGMLNKLRNVNTAGKYYFLYSNISGAHVNQGDAGQGSFAPIPSFGGTLNGNNKYLMSFVIKQQYKESSTKKESAGLIAQLNSGTIFNVNLGDGTAANGIKVEINADNVGALAGIVTGSSFIENIQVTTNTLIKGVNNVGGLIGNIIENGATVRNITINGNGSVQGTSNIGGVVGFIGNGNTQVAGTFTNWTNERPINAAASNAGGLAGLVRGGTFQKLHNKNTATVVGGGNNVGGIFGEAYSLGITGAINEADIGQDNGVSNVGGLFGFINTNGSGDYRGVRTASGLPVYNTGSVSGQDNLGGISGQSVNAAFNPTSYSRIYSSGNIGHDAIKEASNIGGLFGLFQSTSSATNVGIDGSDVRVYGYKGAGGIVGKIDNSTIGNVLVNKNVYVYYRSNTDMDEATGGIEGLTVGESGLGIGPPGGSRIDWTNSVAGEAGGNEFNTTSSGRSSIFSNRAEVKDSRSYKLRVGLIAGLGGTTSNITSITFSAAANGSEVADIYDVYTDYVYRLTSWDTFGKNKYKGELITQQNKRVYKMRYSDLAAGLRSAVQTDYYFGSESNRDKNDSYNTGSVYYSNNSDSVYMKVSVFSHYYSQTSNVCDRSGYYVSSSDENNYAIITNSGWSYGWTDRYGNSVSGLGSGTSNSTSFGSLKYGLKVHGSGGYDPKNTLGKYYKGLYFAGENVVKKASESISGEVGAFDNFSVGHFNGKIFPKV